jgi:hypothetical protein
MTRLLTSIGMAALFGGCAAVEPTNVTADQSLAADFSEAQKLMTADNFDWEAITELRHRLHRRLAEEGDTAFSSVLGTIPEMDRVPIVNVMGFLNPEEYDPYPKTEYLLSSAPKI